MSRPDSIGALTTTFAFPLSCSQIYYPGSNIAYLAQRCISTSIEDDTSCWPNVASSVTLTAPIGGGGIYSPGYICPAGYTSACGGVYSQSGGFSWQFPLTQGESAIGCCPSGGYFCNHFGTAQTCNSHITTAFNAAYSCDSGATPHISEVGLPFTTRTTISGAPSVATFDNILVAAPLFQLVYKTTQLPSGYSLNIPDATSTTAAKSPIHVSASATSSVSPPLSTGAKAGIGVGVAIGALLVIAGIVMFLLRYRKNKQRISTKSYRPAPGHLAEVEDTGFRELDGQSKPAEVEGLLPPSELEADSVTARQDL